MKIRALIGVWLVALMGLAMCGASLPDIGLSSNRGKMAVGLKTSLANGGGVAAGWDTVVVIFTTMPRTATAKIILNNENPAGVDTFALPASSPDSLDVRRIRKLNNIVLGRYAQSYRGDVGDTAIVYRLGTGQTVSSFAYANVNQADADGYIHAAGDREQIYSEGTITYAGVRALNMEFPTASKQAELFYIPFESYLPADCTVVSASVNYSLVGAPTGQSAADTSITTLMTNPNDNKWYLVKDVGSADNVAHASWNYQEDTNAGAWTGTQRYQWNPTFENRPRIWSFGQYCDWTGLSATALRAKENMKVDITNCVQAVVAGQVNNGVLMTYHSFSSSDVSYTHYKWDTSGPAQGRMPYVVVKYITKKYQPPFGTKEWAFLFATDDGVYAANAAYDSVMDAHGGKFTLFASGNALNTAGYCTSQQLMDLYADGNEIGLHSAKHVTTVGLKRYHNTALNAGTAGNLAVGAATTGWDSLVLDTSPEWLYTIAEGLGHTGVRADLAFGKSFAYPNGPWSPEINEALYRHGYTAIRGTGFAAAYDAAKHYEKAFVGAARCDTIWLDGAESQSGRYPRNMTLMAVTIGISAATGHTLVGIKSDPSIAAELDTVTINTQRLAFQLIGQNRRAMIVFTHALKNSAIGYQDGVNPEELDAVLDAVDTFAGGGRYMTYAEYKEWIKGSATMIASPDRAAVPDTFESSASDRIWAKPNGIDNRWIRGVR